MAFRPRHLVAAGTMAGAVVLGGATWASAQDSPSTSEGDSTTTTEEDHRSDRGPKSEDQGPEQQAPNGSPRSGDGCSHGDKESDRDSSNGGDAEASVFSS